MSTAMFEEIDYRPSSIGTLSLRRRRRSEDGEDIYEIKLDEGYLMSSIFTAGEIALADKPLSRMSGSGLDVVVGGLGLGYTAKAVLDDPDVGSLIVVEAIPEVIDWHERKLIPLGRQLSEDARCKFVCGNFFEMAAAGGSFDAEQPLRTYDAVLVDIDHSPKHLLHPANAAFYKMQGLLDLRDKLKPSGIFALWSTDAPDEEFTRKLNAVFGSVEAELVEFNNPYQDRAAINTIYIARRE